MEKARDNTIKFKWKRTELSNTDEHKHTRMQKEMEWMHEREMLGVCYYRTLFHWSFRWDRCIHHSLNVIASSGKRREQSNRIDCTRPREARESSRTSMVDFEKRCQRRCKRHHRLYAFVVSSHDYCIWVHRVWCNDDECKMHVSCATKLNKCLWAELTLSHPHTKRRKEVQTLVCVQTQQEVDCQEYILACGLKLSRCQWQQSNNIFLKYIFFDSF